METSIQTTNPTSTRWEPVIDRLDTAAPKALGRLARAFILKGVLAVAFGLVLLAWPEPTVLAVVLIFGTFAVLDGLNALWTAATSAVGHRWASVVHGIVGVTVGTAVFAWPDITAEALLYVIGAWAIIKGIVELVVAARLRAAGKTRVLLGGCGVLATAFGVFVIVDPDAGAVAVRALTAALAIVTGIGFITAGIGVERWKEMRTRSAADS